MADTVRVSKQNESGDLQFANPQKKDVELWIAAGWAVVQETETKPMKGDLK